MLERRADQLKRYRVAFYSGDRWRFHPAKFQNQAIARTFGAQADPRGYAIEVSKTDWPVAVLYCEPDLAAEIVADLIRS